MKSQGGLRVTNLEDTVLKAPKTADMPVPRKFELIIQFQNREADRADDSAQCAGTRGEGDQVSEARSHPVRFGCYALFA